MKFILSKTHFSKFGWSITMFIVREKRFLYWQGKIWHVAERLHAHVSQKSEVLHPTNTKQFQRVPRFNHYSTLFISCHSVRFWIWKIWVCKAQLFKCKSMDLWPSKHGLSLIWPYMIDPESMNMVWIRKISNLHWCINRVTLVDISLFWPPFAAET